MSLEFSVRSLASIANQ